MTTTLTTAIVDRSGKRFWVCANCGRTLGELVGVRLVIIRHDLHITFPITVGMRQTCPKCHEENEYDG